MSLKNYPELQSFLSTYFSGGAPEMDELVIKTFLSVSSPELQNRIIIQAKDFIEKSESIVEIIGMEANRWFEDNGEAINWIEKILGILNSSENSDSDKVLDSNGAILIDGDAVTVIKDLKVKGGSSDLKRGTLIKKIRLIGDPENIECNVNGSTLVLKTCFLKKS